MHTIVESAYLSFHRIYLFQLIYVKVLMGICAEYCV